MRSSETETIDNGTITNVSVENDVTISRTEPGDGQQKQTVETQTSFGGQFMGPMEQVSSAAKALLGRSTTLTEALKAAAMRVGHKPVEASDAAAIKAVEARTTGTQPDDEGSIAAAAEDAVARNEKIDGRNEGDQTTLSDVIADVDNKLKRDRSVTSEDAEAVIKAELRDRPGCTTTPGGIAESVVTAYKLNRSASM